MKSREEMLEPFDNKYALFGLFFAFGNQLQMAGDSFYEDITCKQFFLLICLNLFQEESPTIKELSGVMGCSHQNVKQMALKLEKKGFIRMEADAGDRRKVRIYKTEKLDEYAKKNVDKEDGFMKYFFEGISDEEISGTYKVMNKLEDNLENIRRKMNEYNRGL
ncbi:MAG: MarR family transcriptional regulator [Lachnospiraceae bacterium]|nr:MarR family transcriptional regulator [Lachnospiraceae bacterium]NCD03347.1 MarR family transcriptional regulator [Clostridia bacterium]